LGIGALKGVRVGFSTLKSRRRRPLLAPSPCSTLWGGSEQESRAGVHPENPSYESCRRAQVQEACFFLLLLLGRSVDNLAFMKFFHSKPPPSLLEEHVLRLAALDGRLQALEDRLEERLEELSRRYRRAEQSEKRLEDVRDVSPCAEPLPSDDHPAVRALRIRRANS
jgi:hypothetical protein